jgi:hypothetical protein
VNKKTEKPIKLRKLEKKITEKTEPWKKTDRFGSSFINLKSKKPNRTQTKKTENKPSQTGSNRFGSVFISFFKK